MNTNAVKSTLLVLITGCLALYLIFSWKGWAVLSFLLGLIGVFSPWLSEKIHWSWMRLADLLGMVVPKIVLTMVFYGVLFPLALISRLFRRDPLMLSEKYDSYFIDLHQEPEKEDFTKIW